MPTTAGNNLISNPRSVHGRAQTPETSKNYVLYVSQNRTLSKSAKSKLKNLAYTLSQPFRYLMKDHLEKSVGTRNSKDAMKNINAPTTSIRKTGPDSASTPKKFETINTTNGCSDYEIVGGNEGYRSTLAERLWGKRFTDDSIR